MRIPRVVALLVAVAALNVVCKSEPTAAALTDKGVANLKNAKTVQLDGIGSLALKAQNGISFSFDFKLSGDAELPDKARMSVELTVLGNAFKVDTIAIAGKEYTLDAASGKWTAGSGTPRRSSPGCDRAPARRHSRSRTRKARASSGSASTTRRSCASW
ncbi:MAG: hypothetical protein E6J35_11425 [Chloroflexi bacterium]|nr:MAG: hypothetical protein E6J35_11425 [Chloroflexota bacterium]